jgi:acyl homoserine lactone synthase
MIEAFTMETAHHLGDVLPAMLRLRHQVFVERQRYEVPTLRGMEWDQFDTPAAVYLVWRDDEGAPRAVARLIPTTFPYMIRELWPDMVAGADLPSQPDVWELSRLGVDRTLPAEQRQRAIGEMMCAIGEFALLNGIGAYLLVTSPFLLKGAIIDAGWNAEILGETKQLGRFPVIAARVDVTEASLRAARRHHGVSQPVLKIIGSEMPEAA